MVAVLLAVLLTTWVTFTLTRLDRLHARVDAAQAALDAQLVRRAAALLHLGEMPGSTIDQPEELVRAARAAMTATPANRRVAENEVGHAIAGLAETRAQLPADAVDELSEAAARVLIARRFFNDAVRDTRTLRARRMPRMLRLSGHRELPQFFDIDDTSLLTDERTAAAEPGAPDARTRWPDAT